MKTMVPRTNEPISAVHRGGRTITPNSSGEFEVADGDVDAMRLHGLRLKSEAEGRDEDQQGA